MPLFENPFANLVAGLGSLTNPNLIPGILQQQQLARKQGLQNQLAGLLNAPNIPGITMNPQQRQGAAAGLLAQMGQPQAALSMAFPEPTKPTTLMQNVEAMGPRPGTPEYQAAIGKALFTPKTQIDLGTKSIPISDLKNLELPNGKDVPVGTTYDQAAAMGVRLRPEKMTEGEAKSVDYTIKALNAMQSLENPAYDPTGLQGFWDKSMVGGNYTNWLASDAGQSFVNDGKAFVAAILRKESGAQVTQDEWSEFTPLYIPQPGDKSNVLTRKALRRKAAIDALRSGVGREGMLKIENYMAKHGWNKQSKRLKYNPQTGRIE